MPNHSFMAFLAFNPNLNIISILNKVYDTRTTSFIPSDKNKILKDNFCYMHIQFIF